MRFVQYVCASSGRKIDGRLDENIAWFEFREVAHLFGMNLEQAAKLLRQACATGDIESAKDVRSSDCCKYLLSHRAVVAVGYQVNYGRATAFRAWCASGLAALSFQDVMHAYRPRNCWMPISSTDCGNPYAEDSIEVPAKRRTNEVELATGKCGGPARLQRAS